MPTKTIPIKQIVLAGHNREHIDEAELAGLAKTMSQKWGMLAPIVARPIGFGAGTAKNGKVELVTGERRLLAAMEHLKWKEIEVNVMDLTDEEAKELRLIENIQRVPLNAWEEGTQVLALGPLPVEEIALRLGRDPKWVATRRAIGKLIPALKALVREQDWPLGHLPLLARIPAEQQPAILEAIVDNQKVEWCETEAWTPGGPTQRKTIPLVPTAHDLADFLAQYQRLLSSAPWRVTDAELLPQAGACTTCPKRASAQHLLFPELADVKSDRCLDETCWSAKQSALVVVNVNKLRDKEAEPVLLKAYEPVQAEVLHQLGPAKIESHSDFTECKKTTPGAVQAVVVSGTEAGTVKYVKPTPGHGHSENTNGSANGAGGGKRTRPVDQDTGEREELSTDERQLALRLKRQCRAGEIWAEKLEVLKPPFKGVVDGLLIWFGTWEKREHRGDWDWNEREKHKLALNVDAWEQLYPLFRHRLKRQGPLEQGAAIWREAACQAKALEFPHVLKQCWEEAVKEIPLLKVLAEQGVKDDATIPSFA